MTLKLWQQNAMNTESINLLSVRAGMETAL